MWLKIVENIAKATVSFERRRMLHDLVLLHEIMTDVFDAYTLVVRTKEPQDSETTDFSAFHDLSVPLLKQPMEVSRVDALKIWESAVSEMASRMTRLSRLISLADPDLANALGEYRRWEHMSLTQHARLIREEIGLTSSNPIQIGSYDFPVDERFTEALEKLSRFIRAEFSLVEIYMASKKRHF